MNRWLDGWMNGWLGGRMNEQVVMLRAKRKVNLDKEEEGK